MPDEPSPQPEPQPEPHPAATNMGIPNYGGGGGGATSGYIQVGGGAGGGTIAGNTTASPPPPDEKKITAAAKKQATADMAAELGCTVEEAKKILAQARSAEDAQKSEAQRLHDDAVAKNAQADQVLAAAAADRLALKVERKLLAAGVPEAALARVAQTVNVPADADDDAIAAEVETLKAELPGLFTPASAAPPPPAPGVTPPRPPTGGTRTESEWDKGERLARERFPHLQPAQRSS